MRRLRLLIESCVGAIFAAVGAGMAGLLIGGMLVVCYYVARILLAVKPYIGASPAEIMSSISDTTSFGFWAVALCCGCGVLSGFVHVFSRIWRRRSSIKDFVPR